MTCMGKWRFTWLSLVMSLMVSYLVLSFSHEMSWMRSETELCKVLRIFPTFSLIKNNNKSVYATALA